MVPGVVDDTFLAATGCLHAECRCRKVSHGAPLAAHLLGCFEGAERQSFLIGGTMSGYIIQYMGWQDAIDRMTMIVIMHGTCPFMLRLRD
jgi:hypothetical protein